MKVIEIVDNGFVWHVPLSVIATHRAKYYAERDKDTTFDEEFDYVMEDSFEGLDWFMNDMNWEDVEASATLVTTPELLKAPRLFTSDCDCAIAEVQEDSHA